MVKKTLSQHIKTATSYSTQSNVVAGLLTTVVMGRIPESLTEVEQKLALVVIMAVLSWVSNIAIVIYKKKALPRFNVWLNKG